MLKGNGMLNYHNIIISRIVIAVSRGAGLNLKENIHMGNDNRTTTHSH